MAVHWCQHRALTANTEPSLLVTCLAARLVAGLRNRRWCDGCAICVSCDCCCATWLHARATSAGAAAALSAPSDTQNKHAWLWCDWLLHHLLPRRGCTMNTRQLHQSFGATTRTAPGVHFPAQSTLTQQTPLQCTRVVSTAHSQQAPFD